MNERTAERIARTAADKLADRLNEDIKELTPAQKLDMVVIIKTILIQETGD